MRQIGFLLILCLANPLSASDASEMPEGLENVYISMPMSELLKVRKNLKSGSSPDYCSHDNHCPEFWGKDPNNPKNPDYTISPHRFMEKYDLLLFDKVYYYFLPYSPHNKNHRLKFVLIEGGGHSLYGLDDYPRRRDEIISYLLKKWGRPARVVVIAAEYGKGLNCSSVNLAWRKNGVSCNAEIPVDISGCSRRGVFLRLLEYVWSFPPFPLMQIRLQEWTREDIPARLPGKIVTGKDESVEGRGRLVSERDAVEVLKNAGLYERLNN